MTIDEELNKLDDDLRRLKIEYEVYFNGSVPRPPHDTLYRVESTIKRYSSDQSKLNFSQRFRFTAIVQKYAVNANLWRRKLQEKEEGRSLTGIVPRRHKKIPAADGVVRVVWSDPDAESEKVQGLLHAMLDAKRQVGEPTESLNPDVFQKFLRTKTKQIKDTLGCEKVQFSVSVEGGKVKFKATKAD